MPDLADIATQTSDMQLNIALQKHREKQPAVTGFCLNCDEPLGNERFCDKDCAEDWEKRNRR